MPRGKWRLLFAWALVLGREALRHRPQKADAHGGVARDELLEFSGVEHAGVHGSLGVDRGGAREPRQRRHLAEKRSLPLDPRDLPPGALHPDSSAEKKEGVIGLLALAADLLAVLESHEEAVKAALAANR